MRGPAVRAAAAAAALLLAALSAPAEEGCTACHRGLPEPRLSDPVRKGEGDVHFRRGLECSSCHGGDPRASSKEAAHDAAKGYAGVPRGAAVVAACGRCHSDAEFMKGFNPTLRLDQEVQWRGSHHGKKSLAGDEKAAHCASCHGNHGVLPVKDPSSPVYPSHVPETCGRCHGDAALMAGRKIPADVPDKYRRGVHGKALLERGDLAAPACNDCHGNHGATPPLVDSVANVCGTCHSRQADLFRASKKKPSFDRNELPECVFCHSEHEIHPPSDAMLGTGKESVCLQCHEEPTDSGFAAASRWESGFREAEQRIAAARAVLERAEHAGMEVAEPIYRLTEARDHVTEARVLIHGFEAGKVLERLGAAGAVATTAQGEGEAALGEIQYRRRGLYVSLVAIAVLALGLWLKIRDVDRRTEGGDVHSTFNFPGREAAGPDVRGPGAGEES